MVIWSPEQYLKYASERTQASLDLAARISVKNPVMVVDIGCGPGNSTSVLLQRFPKAHIIGMDTSPEMLARAKADLPDVQFELADAATWTPQDPVDVLFSNAVFQWVPDHRTLLPRLFNLLKPGGALAFQIPYNWQMPSHVLIKKVATEGPWAEDLKDASKTFYPLEIPEYYDVLAPLTRNLQIWTTTYYHIFDGVAGIVDFNRSTALLPYIQRLSPDQQTAFLAQYEEELKNAYEPRPDGHILLQFIRLFAIAIKPAQA